MEETNEDINKDKNNNTIDEENSEKIEEMDNSKLSNKDSSKKINTYENDIIGENINNEEESQKSSSIEINGIKSPVERRDTTKITGDEVIKTYFNKNSYYLGNLFMDIVNKYDGENDLKERRQLLRKTISNKKIMKEELKAEIHPFNFNDIINVQLNEVKQNTLSYLDKAKSELDKIYRKNKGLCK